MEILFVVAIIVIGCFLGLSVFVLKRLKKDADSTEIIIGTLYSFSLALFAIGMTTHSNPYYNPIDPVDMGCYSPFSDRHALTLIFYFLASNISMILIWNKNQVLPPLTLTLSLIFIVIGIILNSTILLQISVHDTMSLDNHNGSGEQVLFLFAPPLSILIGSWLTYEAISNKSIDALERTYSNKYLNILNTFLITRCRNPLWIVILLLPILLFVTLILVLFGQDTNSIIKVFTDTATWKLSQQVHPPILNHRGHYLCTVAALGHPKIVKPLRVGQRNGRQIIVNRQLLISNAFEEMIQDFSPKLHGLIRTSYDKYGYNISRQINTTFLSSITYILMKPLEWMFLTCLYLFCNNPEQKISRQYAENVRTHNMGLA
jgi:hypothetical protein